MEAPQGSEKGRDKETDGGAEPRPSARVLRTTRALIRRNPGVNRVYRTSVGVVGVGTDALGVALIPLPGPGSLIALGGLALLGTEFDGAKRTSTAANAAARKVVARAPRAREQRRQKNAAAEPS